MEKTEISAKEAYEISVERYQRATFKRIKEAAQAGYKSYIFHDGDNVDYNNLKKFGYDVGEPYKAVNGKTCRVVSWREPK